MEPNRKRRGFIKGKPTPFYRAAKPAPAMQYTTKVKPNQASSTTAFVSFRVHQDYKISQPKQVSFIVPVDKMRENLSQIDNFFGFAGDETVDIKAATYNIFCSRTFQSLNESSSKKLTRQQWITLLTLLVLVLN